MQDHASPQPRSWRNVLVLDTETTGVSAEEDRIVEIGAILFSVQHACSLASWSTLIAPEPDPDNPAAAPTNAAAALNGIPAASLSEGMPYLHALAALQTLAGRADAVVAHNADFDHAFLGPVLDPLPWICTMTQMDWPRATSSQGLVAIALAHGVGIVEAHRALVDCSTIVRLFERCHELSPGCLPGMFARALRPQTRYQAMVTFRTNHLAKAAGFRWNPDEKKWIRKICPEDLEALALRFEVRDLDAEARKPKIKGERVGKWTADRSGWTFCACVGSGPYPAAQLHAECWTCSPPTRGFRPLAKT